MSATNHLMGCNRNGPTVDRCFYELFIVFMFTISVISIFLIIFGVVNISNGCNGNEYPKGEYCINVLNNTDHRMMTFVFSEEEAHNMEIAGVVLLPISIVCWCLLMLYE